MVEQSYEIFETGVRALIYILIVLKKVVRHDYQFKTRSYCRGGIILRLDYRQSRSIKIRDFVFENSCCMKRDTVNEIIKFPGQQYLMESYREIACNNN